MKTGRFTLGFAYLRLSNEEAQGGESSSITNQRMIVQNYCKQNGITLVWEFVDDGWSGGNFDRPGFKEMLRQLLPFCRARGLDRVLLTCHTDNPASAHIILANGGVPESIITVDGQDIQRYWISL